MGCNTTVKKNEVDLYAQRRVSDTSQNEKNKLHNIIYVYYDAIVLQIVSICIYM